VKVIVEQPPGPIWTIDPTPPAEMHCDYSIHRVAVQDRDGIVAEIDRVGVKVVEVEEQPSAGAADDRLCLFRFVEVAHWR